MAHGQILQITDRKFKTPSQGSASYACFSSDRVNLSARVRVKQPVKVAQKDVSLDKL